MGALVGAGTRRASPRGNRNRGTGINWAGTVGGQGRRDRAPIQRKLAGVASTNSLEMGLKAAACGCRRPV